MNGYRLSALNSAIYINFRLFFFEKSHEIKISKEEAIIPRGLYSDLRKTTLNKKNKTNLIQSYVIYKASAIDVLKAKEIVLSKDGDKIILSNASSGEQSLILNILGIASEIENNSIILIDEPEICLHPEWQERYIELLTTTFQDYKRCHFIIATHSPLMIAKLNSENCYVMPMETGQYINAAEFSNKSSDYQLATIFDNPGSQNEYISRITLALYLKLEKNKEFNDYDFDNLVKLDKIYPSIHDTDPLKDTVLLVLEKSGYKLKKLIPLLDEDDSLKPSFLSIIEKSEKGELGVNHA